MKRILIFSLGFAFFVTLFTPTAYAQFEIGASYELRDEKPQSGFGLRIEKGLLEKLPVVNLSLRLHASYFSEENRVDPQNQSYSYSEDFTNYDIGIAGIAGVSLGLIEPYAGLGIGSEDYEKAINDYQGLPGNRPESGEENNLYWNLLAGAKVTVLPMFKPFVEYRYSNKELSEPTLADAQNGRIMFGVVLSF